MATPLPMFRSVPIAPPRPIITSCARLRSLWRPASRLAIAAASTAALDLRGRQGKHAQRASGAVDDLERRSDHHGSGGRQVLEIGEARETEPVRSVHDAVAGKHGIEGGGLPRIGTDGLDAHAE